MVRVIEIPAEQDDESWQDEQKKIIKSINSLKKFEKTLRIQGGE